MPKTTTGKRPAWSAQNRYSGVGSGKPRKSKAEITHLAASTDEPFPAKGMVEQINRSVGRYENDGDLNSLLTEW